MNATLKHTWKHTLIALQLGLQGASAWAQTCNPNIPITRPDSRYEAVANANPAGSEVLDKVTGLIWQRCVQGMSWNGTTCTGTASEHTWQQALELARTATVSAAATGAAAAWRLPNHAELFSLAERACYNPAINTTWFPATPTSNRWAWSASPLADYTDGAWGVDFGYGLGYAVNKNDGNRVRLVRSGQ